MVVEVERGWRLSSTRRTLPGVAGSLGEPCTKVLSEGSEEW
ncbi:unnamed protein product [Musa hybrid cultivar]